MKSLHHIGFILLGFFIFSCGQPLYADPPLPTPVGRVVWIKGKLTALMPNKEERVLQKTSVIYLNDTLMTDNTSQAQIIFTDNTMMTFRSATKFFIDKYQYQPKSKGSAGKYVMRLIEGGFRTITGLIAKTNPNDYQINTPVATIGVRGTDYTIYVHKGELYIGYYEGQPCVTSKKGELCLSDTTRYAFVPVDGSAPVPLSQQPTVFIEKLQIIPAKISPFSPGMGPSKGPVSSFCITRL